MIKTDELLQAFGLGLLFLDLILLPRETPLLLFNQDVLPLNLGLLLFDSVDQDGVELIVSYALNLSLLIVKCEQGLDLLNFLCR